MTHTHFANAIRKMRRTPLNSLLIIMILGIGVGAVLFTLTLINGMILKPLPYEDPQRLYAIGQERKSGVGLGDMESEDFLVLARELGKYGELAAFAESSVVLSRGAQSKPLTATRASANLFDILGVAPILGRGFAADEDRPGAPLAVLIGERQWRISFGADPAILGTNVNVNGRPASVVGVMPEGFGFPYTSELWMPAQLSLGESDDVSVLARLAAGVSAEQAAQILEQTTESLGSRLSSIREDERAIVHKPLDYLFVDEATRAYLWLMFVAAGLVLVLSCSNASSLYLIQTLARRRELALRNALGAGSRRLAMGQLVDAFIHGSLAALVAMVVTRVAIWLTLMGYASVGRPAPYYLDFGVDLTIAAFAFLCAVIVTAVSGFMPARQAAGADLRELLNDGERSSESMVIGRTVNLMVIGEIAFSVVLLVGAATSIRGLDRIVDANDGVGVSPEVVLVAELDLAVAQPQDQNVGQSLEQVGRAMRADSRVVAASVTTGLPGVGYGSVEELGLPDVGADLDDELLVNVAAVDDQFLSTFGIRLASGRGIEVADDGSRSAVVVVDEVLAKRLFGSREPLGQTVLFDAGSDEPMPVTVVGVTAPVQLAGASSPPRPTALLSIRQFPQQRTYVALQAKGPLTDLSRDLPDLLTRLVPDAVVYRSRSLAEAMSATQIDALTLVRVFSAVGVVALFLAVTGLYGLLAYRIRQRTREIGVRRALGETSASLLRSLGRKVAWQLLIGLVIGLALAVPWSMALADPTLGTRGMELSAFTVTAVMLVSATVAAVIAPLWRALRIQPMVALRDD